MLAELKVRYADTRAGQLTWQLGLPALPYLAELQVPVGGGTVGLRLLGASHQVLVDAGDVRCSEAVACRAGGAPLPRAGAGTAPGYRLRARFERLEPAALAARVERLVTTLGERDDALVGNYPGDPLAVTALAVADAPAAGDSWAATPVTWRSWHVYPQTGEVVTTVTELDVSKDLACA